MDKLQNLADFVTRHGGTLVGRDTFREGGDDVEQLIFKVSSREFNNGELRLSRSIRDGFSCFVRMAGTNDEGGWKPIFAYTVPGYETMDIEASLNWLSSVPQGDAYLDFLKQHIEKFLYEGAA